LEFNLLNELKVGLFTLIAIASLVTVSLKITSNQTGFGESIEYKTFMDDATGIFPKTQIKVAGINAGRIKDIELTENQALVTFEISKKIKVTEGSRIRVKTIGFLGDKYIELQVGPKNAARLAKGTAIESVEGGGIENLAQSASEVITEVKEIVKSIKESLKDDNQENALRKIVLNVKDITETLKNVTAGKEKSLADIVDNIAKLTEQLAYESDRNSDGSFMADMKKVGPILDDAKKAMADLQEMMADLKAGKGTIGRLMRDEAVVDQVSQTLSSVNRLVNRINNIEADISLFTGLNSNGGNHTQFDVDLFPAPERFFRLGIVQNNFGPDGAEVRTITTTTGNTTTIENRRDVLEDKIKFNLQIGRRIQRFGLRAGFIESTGGIGIDYHFPDYGSRLSMELFDYQDNVGPNVRLIAEMKLWNMFFTRLTGEDLINGGNQSATVLVGLRFTDQDLAALIGLMAR
jgi:phospholipid/cholesterol/gamma-HCH transport system substrate-binding protein